MESEPNNLITAKRIIEYLFIITILIGILFNIPAFIVFSRKKFKNTIFSTYFRYLCISDTITLLFKFEYIFYLKVFDWRSSSIYLCKIINYFVYLIPSFSIWILVVISLDRYLSIVYPTRFLFRKLKKNQILISLAIIIFHAIFWLSVPLLANITVKNNSSIDKSICNYGPFEVDIMDIMDSSILPLLLMFCSTLLTLRTLYMSRFKSQNNQQQSTIKPRDIKFTISSISLNVLFFLFNIPLTTFLVVKNFIFIEIHLKSLLGLIFASFFYVNYCNVFFISYFLNLMFRKELKLMLNEFRLKFI
jgi:hypothetical protein